MTEKSNSTTTINHLNGSSSTPIVTKKHLKLPPSTLQKVISLHQWPCFIFIVIIILMGQNNPQFRKFYRLQYKNEETGLYTKGFDDIYFVAFWIIALLFLRWFIQATFLTGLAWLMGVKGSKKLTKFKEAGYFGMWHSFILSWGFSTVLPLGWLFDIKNHWAGYPHVVFGWDFKFFYLIQSAFWVSCIFVILIEEKRKDFIQMIAHHFVTTGLLSFSYCMNFTRIGAVVLLNQDIADILLYFSKVLNYSHFERLCTICFALFALTWFVTRHIIYFGILWSIVRADEWLEYGWNPAKEYYFNSTIRYSYLAAFGVLQMLLLFWFSLLVKMVYRVASGKQNPSDIRSDDEGEVEVAHVDKKKQ